ncbi:MAG: amidohydrolase family protein, partial [Bacteroidota bacterium]|nr:amidohydrolase family protein [Bacteroidota bacterium]
KELELFVNNIPLAEKKITAEVCVHHLHFTADDYDTMGYLIKCNPAIKKAGNKLALWEALLDDRLDVIATDHAPHTLEEKDGPYEHAHSGLPLVQHSLLLMLAYFKEGKISLEKIAEKMSHAVADCFKIENRGYIKEGYFADVVVVDLAKKSTITKDNLLYKCGWSPMEGYTFPSAITATFVNGNCVYSADENYGNSGWDESVKGRRISFLH